MHIYNLFWWLCVWLFWVNRVCKVAYSNHCKDFWPLRSFAFFVICLKILFQLMCMNQHAWDDPLQGELHTWPLREDSFGQSLKSNVISDLFPLLVMHKYIDFAMLLHKSMMLYCTSIQLTQMDMLMLNQLLPRLGWLPWKDLPLLD